MRVEFHSALITVKAPRSADTPWLAGRGPRRQLWQHFELSVDGKRFTVPAGYIFDGSSIPWFLWWLFPPGYDPAYRASAFHDWLYSHMYHSTSKRFADDAFKAIMLKDGASPRIAGMFHWAVSRFGKGGW